MGPGETPLAGHGQGAAAGAGVALLQCPAGTCHEWSTVEEGEQNKVTLGEAGGRSVTCLKKPVPGNFRLKHMVWGWHQANRCVLGAEVLEWHNCSEGSHGDVPQPCGKVFKLQRGCTCELRVFMSPSILAQWLLLVITDLSQIQSNSLEAIAVIFIGHDGLFKCKILAIMPSS